MNLWTDDNSSVMESSSDLSLIWPTPPRALSAAVFNQDTLQQCLQILIEGDGESWTYAIFWQSSYDYSGSSILGWGDGYYKGEEDKGKAKAKATSAAEQDHRKKVLLELNSLIPGSCTDPDEALDDEVTDAEWFFVVSMNQSFVNGSGLPGQAFLNSTPVWVTGGDRLSASACERARQGQVFGLQTLVCIPSENGVLELGSTELIFFNTTRLNTLFDLLVRTRLLDRLSLDRLRKNKLIEEIVRAPCCDKSGLRKGLWSPEEDRKLVAYITRYGPWNWRQLPKFAGLARNGKSCRHRWINYLRPQIERGNHSQEEDETIIRFHEKLGNSVQSSNAERWLEETDNDMVNCEHDNSYKSFRGKEKISDLKWSWPLLTDSSDISTDTTSNSCSHDYSGPS